MEPSQVATSPIRHAAPPDAPVEPGKLPERWLDGSTPLEFDLGCHRGAFLIAMAHAHPDRYFLGIERQVSRAARSGRKIERQGLANAAVICGDGFASLRGLPSSIADHIHVLFPDPWPKRRHHSRRMVQPLFLDECARLLKNGGRLRLVTDDAPYASAMRSAAAAHPDFGTTETEDRDYPPTEFQRKFEAGGLPIHRVLLIRRAGYAG